MGRYKLCSFHFSCGIMFVQKAMAENLEKSFFLFSESGYYFAAVVFRVFKIFETYFSCSD